MTQSNIKYRYATDADDNVIDILSLNRENPEDRKDYVCLGCGMVLRPVLPQQQAKHFRHKTVGNCSLETYLHRMGIRIFQETYQRCLEKEIPFILTVPVKSVCRVCKGGPCNKETTPKRLDLTKTFSRSEIEPSDVVGDSRFVPDILLSNDSGDKTYVEIVYSHASEGNKINTGIPIIEIDITEEGDFALIESTVLKYNDHRLRLYNFPEETLDVDASAGCSPFQERTRIEKQHHLFKELFRESYISAVRDGEPVTINIARPVYCNACERGQCPLGHTNTKFDLTKHFKKVVSEEPLPGDTEPRMAIETETGRKIYVEYGEVFRVNPAHQECIATGEQIVDLYRLPTYIREFSPSNQNYKLYNFNPSPIYRDSMDSCVLEVHLFRVFHSGKARIDTMSYQELKTEPESPNILFSKEIPNATPDVFIEEVEDAFRKGVAIKSCFLCRYHGIPYNYDRQPIYCKFLKRNCGSNKAAKCEYYRPDPNVIGKVRHQRSNRIWS